jgi:hypothetical protein
MNAQQIADWRETSQGLARQFRLGMSVPAALALVEFLTALSRQLATQPAVASAPLAPLLGGMLACQEGQDWLGLADYLDVELPEFLDTFTDA